MSMGIEHFRTLVTEKGDLENRRVTTEEVNGRREIQAPNSLWGRFVHWIKEVRGEGAGEQRAQQNVATRTTFYQALVKSEGEDFAKAIIEQTFGLTPDEFMAKTSNLQASKIKQVLDTRDSLYDSHVLQTHQAVQTFIENGNLKTSAQLMREGLGHPDLRPGDPELKRTMEDLVRKHPDYGHRLFSDEELVEFARQAVKDCCEAKQARFDEQYPKLAKLDNGHFHDIDTYFTCLENELSDPPFRTLDDAPNAKMGDVRSLGRLWFDGALEGMKESSRLLGKMTFDPNEAEELRRDINIQISKLNTLVNESTVMSRHFFMHEQRLGLQKLMDTLYRTRDKFTDDQRKQVYEVTIKAFNKIMDPHHRPDLSDPQVREELAGHICGELNVLLAMTFELPEDQRREIVGGFRDLLDQGFADPMFDQIAQCHEAIIPMHESMQLELQNQIGKLTAKSEFLDEFVQNDPLSDKAVAYDKLIWSQSTELALKEVIAKLQKQREELPQDPRYDRERQKIDDAILELEGKLLVHEMRIAVAEEEWKQASPERTVTPKDTGKTHKLKQQRDEEVEFLRECMRDAKVRLGERTGDLLQRSRTRALETMQDWHTISRDMVIPRDGVTRTYRSVITPGSKIGGAVGRGYVEDDIKGVSSGNRTDPRHARNLQVSELHRVEKDENGQEKEVLVSQTISHGVLVPWDIDDPELRRQAQQEGAREVLNTVVEINGDFKAKALQKREQGMQLPNEQGLEQPPPPPPQPNKIVHVNFNLTTSDTSLLKTVAPKNHSGDFTFSQFEAFEQLNGRRMLSVETMNEDGGEPEIVEVPFDIDTITFSFDVTEPFPGSRMLNPPDGHPVWVRVEQHDRANMIKLLGDLGTGSAPGGYIGGIVDRLKAEIANPDTPQDQREAMQRQVDMIQREVDVARDMFMGYKYQNAREDGYKMVRTVERVVELGAQGLRLLGDDEMVLSLSDGGVDNVNRGGISDVERKSQAIIEDMGGRVEPGQEFSEQDQTIYNIVLTTSGLTEVQRQNTGLGGTDSVGDLEPRIDDPKALEYARGFGQFNKTSKV